jgi:hypothetical protein
MPLYEFRCANTAHPSQEHFLSIDARDQLRPPCTHCGEPMKRVPGGHGMLYFEEGRARLHRALSDKPISSYAEHKRLMRQHGVVECGNTVPKSVAKNPRSEGLKRFLGSDKGGRWL